VPPLPIVATPITPAPPAPPEPLLADGAPSLEAVLIDRVPEGTFGPYVGSAPDGRSLLLWAALAQNDGWRWYSSVLDAKGGVLSKPRALAEAPSDLSLATISSTATGYVALAAGVTPTGTRLEALSLGPSGELGSGPTPLVHSRTEVLWVKALSSGGTNVALWATLAVGAADVYLAPLSTNNTQQAAPVRVLEGAKAWQAVEFGDGIALAAVIVGVNEASRSLLVKFLDSDGRSLGQTEVASGASLDDQVDAARVGENLVVSWTERQGADGRLYLAALGPDTHLVAPPEPVTRIFGRQRLVELLPPALPRGAAIVAWEQRGQAPRGQRRIQLGRVNERGRLEAVGADLTFSGGEGDEPELSRKGEGVAALTSAGMCARDATSCETPEPAPTFVELGPDFELVASEPVRLAPEAGKLADLAWGLHCTREICSSLGALPTAPVPIYGVELRARSRSWPAAASKHDTALPQATELRAVADTDPLADVAAARAAGGWLVATLTQFDDSTPYVRRKTPAPDGKLAPLRALLAVQQFGNSGAGEPAKVISYRARASSGIALARLKEDKTLLAWTALDRERPEVFATLLGKNGVAAQRMLTRGAGDVTALAAAPLARGSVVAWLSDRDGEPRLYAARLNEDLVGTAPEQRLSPAGGFTGLGLMRHGDEPWLVSARREEREEVLSVTRLDAKTAARRGEEVVLARGEANSFTSPVIVARADGALVAWVERPLVGGGVASARVVALDSGARPLGEPVSVPSVSGEASAIRLYCDGAVCQGVIDARPPEGTILEGFDWSPAIAPASRLLAFRQNAASDPAAFALSDGAVFHADRIEQRGLLRRLAVSWR
jgi:hypothetical protein